MQPVPCHRYFDRDFFQRQEQFEDFEVSRRCISLLDGTYGKGVAGNMKRKGKTTQVVVTSCDVEDIQVITPFLLRAHLGCTLQHPNILQTVGVVTNRLPLLVASQWQVTRIATWPPDTSARTHTRMCTHRL